MISQLPNSDGEFTVQEIVNRSAELLHKPFGGSNVNQMLAVLCEHDLIYKNRHGRYSFAAGGSGKQVGLILCGIICR